MEPIKEDVDNLHVAAYKGQLEVMKYLVEEEKVEPNTKDNNGTTALHCAASKGHLKVVKYLIEEKGIEPNTKDNNGRTALHVAAHNGVAANNGVAAHNGVAANNGQLEVMKYLIEEKGIEPNTKDNNGRTALHVAAHKGHLKVVQCLVEKGVEPNTKDNNGATALHAAANHGRLKVVQCLVEKGVEPNTKTNNGWTALHAAAYEGRLEVVQYLVEEEKVEPNTKTNKGYTALHFAAYKGRLEVVQYLVEEEKVEPNTKDNNGATALHAAANHGRLKVVQCLVEKGVEPNTKTNNGWTALHAAAYEGQLEVMKYLVEEVGVPTLQLNKTAFNNWKNIDLYDQFVELADKLFDEEQCQQLRQQPIQAITDENRVRNLSYSKEGETPWAMLEHNLGTAFTNRFKHKMRREGVPEAMWCNPTTYFQGLKLPDSFKENLQDFTEEINRGRENFILHSSGVVALLEDISPTPLNQILYPPENLSPYNPEDPMQKLTTDFYAKHCPELKRFISNKINEEEQKEACERALCQYLKDYLEKLRQQDRSPGARTVNYNNKGKLIDQIQAMITSTDIVYPTQFKEQLKQLSEVLITPDIPNAVEELNDIKQKITALLDSPNKDIEAHKKMLQDADQGIKNALSKLGTYEPTPSEEQLKSSSQPARKRQKTS